MNRTPTPKTQAKILAGFLGELGFNIPHQKSLELVARLQGHRDWNALSVVAKAPPEETTTDASWLVAFRRAAQDVVSSADAEGCASQLTVANATAVSRLGRLLGSAAPVPQELTVAGFGVGDVLTLRPDISEEQAEEALEYCGRRFDAEVGMNWTVLELLVDQHIGSAYLAEGVLHVADKQRPVVVNMATGQFLDGTLASLKEQGVPSSELWNIDNLELPRGARIHFGTDVSVDMYMMSKVCDGDSSELRVLYEDLVAHNIPLRQYV